ncbi:MAG: N-acetyltransferase family protein [Halosimplex sp.]
MSGLTVRRYRPGDGERVRELNRAAMAETPEWVPEAPDDDLRDVRGHYLDAGGEFLVGEVDDASGLSGLADGADSTDGRPVATGDIVATGAYEPLEGWMAEQFEARAGEGTDPEPGVAELSRVRVDPAVQGHGVGTEIVRELERRARRSGVRAFALNTGVDNERARGFYESLGYSVVREASVEFGDVTLDLALYRRRLGD